MAKYDREQFLATAGASRRPYTTGKTTSNTIYEDTVFVVTMYIPNTMMSLLHHMLLLYTGSKQGILYKRMKQSEVWNGRWFVLADRQLSYYKSYSVSCAS